MLVWEFVSIWDAGGEVEGCTGTSVSTVLCLLDADVLVVGVLVGADWVLDGFLISSFF